MSENGTALDTPSHTNQGTPGAEPEPTVPLWFGERAQNPRHPSADPSPSSWTTPPPATPLPATPPTSPQRPRRQWPGLVAVAALTAALASGGTYAAVRAADDGTASSAVTSSSAAPQSPAGAATSGATATTVRQADANNPNWTEVAKVVTPSVVAISLQIQGGSAQGSGVVIDTSGHILTNNHVVADAVTGSIEVTLADGRIYKATVAGTDPATDLAVITLTDPPSGLQPIALGNSSTLVVGQPVMAVGNPLGLASTVTTGIVSALNRPVETTDSSGGSGGSTDPFGNPFGQQGGSTSQTAPVVTNAIQTSAAINPGNSGGALVNGSGELIGINSSIASTGSSGGNIGIGFAIPVNEAKSIADQLIASGKATHAYLGVTLDDGNASDGSATRAGAQVTSVSANTPAAAAGLKTDDVIVAIDGQSVESSTALIGHIREQTVGGKVTLTVIRDGKSMQVAVTLAARPDN